MSEQICFDPLPWSWTKLQQAKTCPLSCYLHSIELPSTRKNKIRDETRTGLLVHKVGQLLMSASGEAVISFDESTASSLYFDNLKKFITTDIPHLQKEIGFPHVCVPELAIRLDKNLKPTFGYPNGYITGKLDLCLYNPMKKSCLIIDYKTRKDKKPNIDMYKPQLELYSLLFNCGFAEIERIGLAIYSCYYGELDWITSGFEKYNHNKTYSWLKNLIQEAWSNLKEIKPVRNDLCYFCDFRSQCPIYTEEPDGYKDA